MKEHGAYTGSEARSYDRDRETEPLWRIENEYVAQLVQRLSPLKVLDVPVGTGRFLATYAGASVEGIDLSEAMLAEAAERVALLRLDSVRLMQASVTALPFQDGQFDLVVCWRLLHLLHPDQLVPAFVEMARVCNGRLCVQVYERAPWKQRMAAKGLRWTRRIGLLLRRKTQLTPWSHIRVWSHSLADIEHAATCAGLGTAESRTDFGEYEGTRVTAMVWALPK